MNYYRVKAVSNSSLGGGIPKVIPKRLAEAFKFGNLFDSLITDPEMESIDLDKMLLYLEAEEEWKPFTKDEWERCLRMRDRLFAQPFWEQVAQPSIDAGSVIFQHKRIGAWCNEGRGYMKRQRKMPELERRLEKLRSVWEGRQGMLMTKSMQDIRLTDRPIIIDIKTTAVRSYQEFQDRAKNYGYDRQAASYLDMDKKAEFFILCAVSKKPPYNTFIHQIKKDSGEYHRGQNEYRRLIQKKCFN